MAEAVPIRIRGRDYPSIEAAARAIGVSRHSVDRALRNGTLETVGVPNAQSINRRGNTNARRCPFVAFGRSFPSQAEAARQFGVARSTVMVWLARDRDRLMAEVMKLDAAEARRARS